MTTRAQQYFVQLNYAGADGAIASTYATGLQSLAAGQTDALNLRALRDRQTPDTFGRGLPLAATRGQVSWTVDGDENLVFIGRAEQADLAHALSSSYACVNCCPASFADAYLNPGSVSGFPGDQTQFSFFEQKEDCFGNPLAPVARNATWSSTDPLVATCDAMGMATGQLPGVTYIQGRWRTFLWDLSANQTCTRTVYDALAEALCNVVGLPNIISISQEIIDESQQGSEVVECGRFRIKVKFKIGCPPPGYTLQLLGHIQEDATLIGAETQEIGNDLEVCTYEATELYRMKNRLDQTIGTGFTSYKATVTWDNKTATKNGPGISTRATIPGVGACP